MLPQFLDLRVQLFPDIMDVSKGRALSRFYLTFK
jgi:hypothetical protein